MKYDFNFFITLVLFFKINKSFQMKIKSEYTSLAGNVINQIEHTQNLFIAV